MKKKKGNSLLTGVITLLLLVLLVFYVFRDNYDQILRNIRGITPWQLLCLLGMGLAYQLLDSAAFQTMIRGQLPRFSLRQGMEVSLLGIFGGVSTLSVGSVPMQSYYLYRCGLAVGSGAGMMTLEYAFHKSAILLYATAMLLFQRNWLAGTIQDLFPYVRLGYGFFLLVIAALILLCTWKRVQSLALRAVELLPETGKWPARKKAWRDNLCSLYGVSRSVFRDLPRCGRVLVLNGLKLLCLYSIPYLCLRFLGFSSLSFGQVQLLSSLVLLIAGALPNLAGMGPTEFAFLLLFSCCMERSLASSALVLYRIASFFFPFLMSILVFLAVERRFMSSPHSAL